MLRNSGPTVSMNALVAFAIIVCGLSTFGGGGVLHHQQKNVRSLLLARLIWTYGKRLYAWKVIKTRETSHESFTEQDIGGGPKASR